MEPHGDIDAMGAGMGVPAGLIRYARRIERASASVCSWLQRRR